MAIASQAPKAIILASRTASKLDAVAADLAEKYPTVAVHKVPLDLASLDSIKAAGAQIDALVDHVDVLINNAGVNTMTRDPIQTPGDTVVDTHFFVNHLGPFLFTYLLYPKLRAAAARAGSQGAPTRIVNVSSLGHQLSPVRFHDYQLAHYAFDGVPESQKPPRGFPDAFLRTVDGYPYFIGYGQSKTANILHASELTRRFHKSGEPGILALSLHPGTIQTELSRSLDEEGLQTIANTGSWKTLDQGASTTLVAAFDPKLGELDIAGGKAYGYLSDCQVADETLAPHAKDPYNAHTLYEESERMLCTKTGLPPVQ